MKPSNCLGKGFVLLNLIHISLCFTDYTGYRLVRFDANADVAKWLENEEEFGYNIDTVHGSRRTLVDVWGEPSKPKGVADVLVAPEIYNDFVKDLKRKGADNIQILRNDIQEDIRRERRSLKESAKRRKRSIQSYSDFDIEDFHSYDEMVQFMRRLSEEKPELVTLMNVSRSSEGRMIYGVKIGTSNGMRPAIFVDAGIHAREWIAPAAALYMIKALVDKYGKENKITQSINKFDWFIVPEVNPDGYEYSRSTDRLWRKTRSRNVTVNRWCVGADANRNWGFRWGEAGANRQPCSNIYAGSSPFSEPEIRGLRDFLNWKVPQLIIYTSLHSYGQLLLAPWGYTAEKTNNFQDQRAAARVAVEAMRNATGVQYKFGTISELMYPASGTSIDYLQHKGVPYIYGIELRPLDSDNSFAFNLPATFIKPSGEEMLAGLIAMGEYAVKHKRL
ncbi:unnamed protein product [Auanema sp. JU1783]|nr:unnamed protein product [Auanema sp. JU1783]